MARFIQRWIKRRIWWHNRINASVLIQEKFRQHLILKEASILQQNIELQAVRKLQKFIRKFIARLYDRRWWIIYNGAAERIQKFYRRYISLNIIHYRIRKLLSDEKSRKEMKLRVVQKK